MPPEPSGDNPLDVSALAHETGGLLVDHGWLRLFGSGHERLRRALGAWNETLGIPMSDFFLVAGDAVGGAFAMNGTALGSGLKSSPWKPKLKALVDAFFELVANIPTETNTVVTGPRRTADRWRYFADQLRCVVSSAEICCTSSGRQRRFEVWPQNRDNAEGRPGVQGPCVSSWVLACLRWLSWCSGVSAKSPRSLQGNLRHPRSHRHHKKRNRSRNVRHAPRAARRKQQ